jgi:hypothetical protein
MHRTSPALPSSLVVALISPHSRARLPALLDGTVGAGTAPQSRTLCGIENAHMILGRVVFVLGGACLVAASCGSSHQSDDGSASGTTLGPAGIKIPAECGQLAGTTGLTASGGIVLTTCSEFFGPAFEVDASSTVVISKGMSCPSEKALCACLRIDHGPPTNCTLDVTYDLLPTSKYNCDPANCKAGPAPGGQTVVFATTLGNTAMDGGSAACSTTATHAATSCDQVQGQLHTCTDTTDDYLAPDSAKTSAAAADDLAHCKRNSTGTAGTPSCNPCPTAGRTASCSVCEMLSGLATCTVQNVYTDGEATALKGNCYAAVSGPTVVFTDYRVDGGAP